MLTKHHILSMTDHVFPFLFFGVFWPGMFALQLAVVFAFYCIFRFRGSAFRGPNKYAVLFPILIQSVQLLYDFNFS